MTMYFIAFVAPAEIDLVVREWKLFMKEHYRCSVALRSPAHITLVPPFWMDEAREGELKDVLDMFGKSLSAFPVQLRDFSSFPPRVIFVNVLPTSILHNTQQAITRSLQQHDFPIKPDDRPFHPHMTIATRDLYKKAYKEAWEKFKTKKYEAEWVAHSISLLKHNGKSWDIVHTSKLSS
jgi:2'-5' RNA ligase